MIPVDLDICLVSACDPIKRLLTYSCVMSFVKLPAQKNIFTFYPATLHTLRLADRLCVFINIVANNTAAR